MSISKMTFSLASLLVMLAFIAAPAMAHDAVTTTHPHKTAPTVESIELYDAQITTGKVSTVKGTSVQLVNDIDHGTAITLRESDAAGQFGVIVTFSEAVFSDIGAGAAELGNKSNTVADRDVLITATPQTGSTDYPSGNNLVDQDANASSGVNVTADSATLLTPDTTPSATTAEANKKYLITFTVADSVADLVDDRDAATTTDNDSIDVWITVNADAMFNRTGLVDGTNTYGTGNTVSTRKKFTIVKSFPVALPTVDITAPEGTTHTSPFTATLTFSKDVPALASSDIEVVGGYVSKAPAMPDAEDSKVWTVEITPGSGVSQVTVGVKDTIATGETLKIPPDDVVVPPGLALAKGAYVVIARPNHLNPATVPNVDVELVTGFPADLAGFLIAGGTIDVVATGGDVIINELMIARDSEKINAGEQNDGQWIELYNKHATETANGIQVTFSSARPAPAEPTGLQDRLSNVVNPGWNFTNKFAGSPDVFNGSTHRETPKDFVSIVRVYKADKTTVEKENGWESAAWGKADTTLTFATNRIGTPGKSNSVKTFAPVTNTVPLAKEVTINEVANRKDDSREWIELKGPAGESLKNWKLSIVTGINDERRSSHSRTTTISRFLLTDICC